MSEVRSDDLLPAEIRDRLNKELIADERDAEHETVVLDERAEVDDPGDEEPDVDDDPYPTEEI